MDWNKTWGRRRRVSGFSIVILGLSVGWQQSKVKESPQIAQQREPTILEELTTQRRAIKSEYKKIIGTMAVAVPAKRA